jgi:5-methylcytosine-specific restriction endonuclease McrA
MSNPNIDQRSTYPATNLTNRNWDKVRNKQLRHKQDIQYKKVAKKRRVEELQNTLSRLRDLEQQFKEFRNKTEKKSPFDYPKYKSGMGKDFYSTREWRELRWKVVSISNGCCSVCGRNSKQHGVILHVDHIKPRSKYPQLELVQSNMQVLCEECNIGKGAKIQTF